MSETWPTSPASLVVPPEPSPTPSSTQPPDVSTPELPGPQPSTQPDGLSSDLAEPARSELAWPEFLREKDARRSTSSVRPTVPVRAAPTVAAPTAPSVLPHTGPMGEPLVLGVLGCLLIAIGAIGVTVWRDGRGDQ